MMFSEKPLAVALTISIAFTIVNIVAVTTGTAEIVYSPIEQLLSDLTQ